MVKVFSSSGKKFMFLCAGLVKTWKTNHILSMHKILEQTGMSSRKTASDRTANLIFLRFQIAQDYWSQVRFIMSKTTRKKSIKLHKKPNSSKLGKFCKLNLFIPFLYIVHEQKNLICSYLN